jgi:hypothetical protein
MEYLELTAEEVGHAWRDLRRFVRENEDVLNVAGVGARLGWSRTSAKALLNPSEGSARTAATLERLAQAQHELAGLGYRPLQAAYYTPVMGKPSTAEARALELTIRKLEADYLNHAADQYQARAIAAELGNEGGYLDRANEIGAYLEGLLLDLATARRTLTALPL